MVSFNNQGLEYFEDVPAWLPRVHESVLPGANRIFPTQTLSAAQWENIVRWTNTNHAINNESQNNADTKAREAQEKVEAETLNAYIELWVLMETRQPPESLYEEHVFAKYERAKKRYRDLKLK